MLNYQPFLLITLLPMCCLAAEKHVHGEGELFIAIDNKQILLELESPADNILGFEHTPKTQAQHKLLDSSLARLNDYSHLIAFSKGACKQISANIESPFEEHHNEEHSEHEEHGHKTHEESKHEEHAHEKHNEESHDEHHNHGDSSDGHSGFHASYTLQCDKNIQSTLTATINAFKHFTNFEKIQINWVTPNKQGSITTTPAKTELKIE